MLKHLILTLIITSQIVCAARPAAQRLSREISGHYAAVEELYTIRGGGKLQEKFGLGNYDYKFPQIFEWYNDTAYMKINLDIVNEIRSFASELDYLSSHGRNLNYVITRADEKYISILFYGYNYDSKWPLYFALTYDVKTGNRLELEAFVSREELKKITNHRNYMDTCVLMFIDSSGLNNDDYFELKRDVRVYRTLVETFITSAFEEYYKGEYVTETDEFEYDDGIRHFEETYFLTEDGERLYAPEIKGFFLTDNRLVLIAHNDEFEYRRIHMAYSFPFIVN
ncbi:MAG: DUF4163 domain-containing protein [Oscillospiraceae bacterium]|jgi:hypothetical protein|nr:DUF4163 domain-containing protein [Oscillospiraceae bacterium]